ncbi:alpha/beta-hydrolase [Aaosphaeria arxii CBS 175.79]|uniref:Alpha/beta-hydrolase n=1 Tax=Aaosphaeria arxii CBS 175.79 TaxID=1450172 RepID=A0A6A5XI67_9PLEO|nr:alpha/beta-hydrolase [Aaosphaeria arxii CBS 175.79]KAF2012014.1 alpha/beta-hydrolase [Aaosphaeria arxii CBS 175.79]
MTASRFDQFDISQDTYKVVGQHEIHAYTLIPKGTEPGRYPLLVKWHGGALVNGDAIYPDWFSSWLVPFMLRNKAIAVLPNYRLLPEHNGADIIEDLDDFWKWVDSGKLAAGIRSCTPGIMVDLDRVCVAGDSAGGFMALSSALRLPEGRIKSVLAQYPMTRELNLDVSDEFKDTDPPGPEVIDEYLKSLEPGAVVTSAFPPEKMPIVHALSIHDKYRQYFGLENEALWPINAIEKAKKFPPTFIFHGTKDTAVSVNDIRAFVKKAKEFLDQGEAEKIKLQEVEGENHGFDGNLREEEVPWLRDGLKYVEDAWKA